MLKKLLLLTLAFALIISFGCDKEDEAAAPETIDEFALLTEIGDVYYSAYTTAGGAGVNIGIADVFTNLTDGNAANDPVILDYRSAGDFATGHLKGAINITLGSLMDKVDDGTVPTDKTVLNVCYTGQTASYATAFLNMLGFEAQNLLFGMCGVTTTGDINGTDKWLNAIATDEFATQLTSDISTTTTTNNFPVLETGEKEATAILKTRFKNIMATTGWGTASATDVFANPDNYFVINYWPEAEYVTPGHIAGAYCFPPKISLLSDAMLSLLPTDKIIVTYCYTGQTSAQVTAYLQALGYNAKSLLYGVNGFAYNALAGHKYVAPVNDYSSIIE